MIDYDILLKLTHDVPDGLDRTAKKEPVSKATRDIIQQRDGFKCILCSSVHVRYATNPRADNYKEGVHIHHILPNGLAVTDNLITLCETCHDLVHLILYIEGKWNQLPNNIIKIRSKTYKKNTCARTGYRIGEKAFTPNEIKKLLVSCATIEDELLLKLGVSLGLRREDMVNIRIADIDLNNNTISYYEHKKKAEIIICIQW